MEYTENWFTRWYEKIIPQRMTKTKEWSPWIDKNLQKLIKRRNRAFQASKKTGKHYYEQKFLGLKRKVQLELRRAYWKHIEHIVSPSEKDVNHFSCMKRFWRFIKHQKKDYTSITTLKEGLYQHYNIKRRIIPALQHQKKDYTSITALKDGLYQHYNIKRRIIPALQH